MVRACFSARLSLKEVLIALAISILITLLLYSCSRASEIKDVSASEQVIVTFEARILYDTEGGACLLAENRNGIYLFPKEIEARFIVLRVFREDLHGCDAIITIRGNGTVEDIRLIKTWESDKTKRKEFRLIKILGE